MQAFVFYNYANCCINCNFDSMNPRIEKLLNYLKETPQDAFLNHALGLEYIKENQLESALACFEINHSTNPNYIGTYYHFAKLLETLQKIDQAIAVYEQGMEQAKLQNDQHSLNELRAAYEDLTF
jgi:tetratricopeptide (TPR) repeat protein